MSAVKRYDWEDALIAAQAVGLLSNGALMTCLKLARAINWVPRGGGPSELRWANKQACETVGLGTSTYYDWLDQIIDAGFMVVHAGNLRPCLPDSMDEIDETFGARAEKIKEKYEKKERARKSERVRKSDSKVRRSDSESVGRAQKSAGHHTYSEDSYSEDLLSEDHEVCSVANAPEPLHPDTHEPKSHQTSNIDTSSEPHTLEPLITKENVDDPSEPSTAGGGATSTSTKVDTSEEIIIEAGHRSGTDQLGTIPPVALDPPSILEDWWEPREIQRGSSPEIFPKDSSVTESVKARDGVREAVAPSGAPLEASVTNAESESAPESQEEMAEAQKPVKGRPRDASGLSGWDTETVEAKPVFDLNAQWDEIEHEQREKSKRDDLETVPPSGTLDDRLAGW